MPLWATDVYQVTARHYSVSTNMQHKIKQKSLKKKHTRVRQSVSNTTIRKYTLHCSDTANEVIAHCNEVIAGTPETVPFARATMQEIRACFDRQRGCEIAFTIEPHRIGCGKTSVRPQRYGRAPLARFVSGRIHSGSIERCGLFRNRLQSAAQE